MRKEFFNQWSIQTLSDFYDIPVHGGLGGCHKMDGMIIGINIIERVVVDDDDADNEIMNTNLINSISLISRFGVKVCFLFIIENGNAIVFLLIC